MISLRAKRSLVKFLDHQPAYISDFNSLAKSTAEKQLKQIDGQIGGLQKDLHAIDPNWAAENLELYQSLNAVILGKGLEFSVMHGHADLAQWRDWLQKEAIALETAAKSIKDKLPSHKAS